MIGTPSQYSPSKLVGPKPPASLEKGEYFLNIKENNRIVGSLWVKKYKDTYVLRDVFVLPEFRGTGIGTRMVQEITEHLKPKNLPIYLYVDPTNAQAISVYRKLNFRLVKKGTFQGDKYVLSDALNGLLVCGPPGIGKSSNLPKIGDATNINWEDTAVVDPDKLAGTHDQQSAKAFQILRDRIRAEQSVAYIGACHGTRGIGEILRAMKQKGFTTKVVVIFTSVSTALDRIAKRSNQPLDPEITKEVHTFFSTKAERFMTLPNIDELYLFNNEQDLTLLFRRKSKDILCSSPNGEFYFDVSKYCH